MNIKETFIIVEKFDIDFFKYITTLSIRLGKSFSTIHVKALTGYSNELYKNALVSSSSDKLEIPYPDTLGKIASENEFLVEWFGYSFLIKNDSSLPEGIARLE